MDCDATMLPKELEAGTQTIYAANLVSYGDPLLTSVKILSMSFALVGVKENLQKLVFPKGISYYHKNAVFLTDDVNEVFQPIPQLNCISESNKNKQGIR